MIKIQFPRKPLSSQRKRAIDFSKKLKYSENEYDSIAESENINDFKDLFTSLGRWQGVSCFVDEIEVDINHLIDLQYCLQNKVPFTNLKWYGISKRRWDDQDFRDLNKKISSFSSEDEFWMDIELQDLQEMGLINVIEYKKRYKVLKREFKEKILNISTLIKKIVPNFDVLDVFKIVDDFPEEFEVKAKKRKFIDDMDENELDDLDDLKEQPIDEPKGDEWVDWYSDPKWHLEVLNLLKKIEQNTRKI